MKSFRNAAIWLALFVVAFLPACGKTHPNMPKTRSFAVEVRNDGAPLKSVTVTLYSPNAGGKYVVSGVTDENGVATLSTSCGSFVSKGAPDGEFKVLIVENVSVVKTKRFDERKARGGSPEDAGFRSREEYFQALDDARTLPLEFSNAETTPFSITIRKGEKRAVVDVANAAPLEVE